MLKIEQKIVKESGIGIGGGLYQTVTAYVVVMMTTHFLTASEFGVFNLARSIANFASVFTLLGLPQALDRYIPIFEGQQERGKTKFLVYQVFALIFALECLVIALMVVGAKPLARIYSVSELAWILPFLSLWLFSNGYVDIIGAVFRGLKEIRHLALMRQVVVPSIQLGFGFSVFLLGFGLKGWMSVFVFSSFTAMMVGFYLFWKEFSVPYGQFAWQHINLGGILRYSWPLSVSSIFIRMFGQVSILFLGLYSTSTEIGVYSLYSVLAGLPTLIRSSFANIYKPVVSEMVGRSKFDMLKDTYVRVTRWIVVINNCLFILILVLGAKVVEVFFGDVYGRSPTALSILVIGQYVSSAVGTEGMTLQALGYTRLSLFNTILMLVSNVILGFLLIPSGGVIGAAVATSVSYALGGLAGLFEIYITHRFHPFDTLYLRVALISLITLGILFGLRETLFGGASLLDILALGSLGTTIYFGALLVFRAYDETDYALLKRLLVELRQRVSRRSSLEA